LQQIPKEQDRSLLRRVGFQEDAAKGNERALALVTNDGERLSLDLRPAERCVLRQPDLTKSALRC
jgi:hypothetical protein